MSCKGELSALAAGARPSPPHSSLTLLSAELFLSHSLMCPSRLLFHHSFFSSPSEIRYPRGATIVADWLGLGQQRVHLRAGWHGLYQTWGKLLAASHRSHRYSPVATKTLPRKPTAIVNCIIINYFTSLLLHPQIWPTVIVNFDIIDVLHSFQHLTDICKNRPFLTREIADIPCIMTVYE